MKVCAIFFILILTTFCHEHTFKCIFDYHNKDITPQAMNNVPEVPVHPIGKHINGRLMQAPSTSNYSGLRIELDTAQLQDPVIKPPVNGAPTTTTTNLNFILQALYVTRHFYESRLQASPLLAITVPASCADYTPTNVGDVINNRQLLIFALYISDSSQAYGATGKSCDYMAWGPGHYPDSTMQAGRPTIGRIIFNTYRLVDLEPSLTNRLFQSVTATTIHEVTHILGFDSTLYNNYLDIITGSPYNFTVKIQNSTEVNSRRPLTSILTTPNVAAWARKHYGCDNLTGMLLENEDGSGVGAGSHWQRAAIYDQVMTATAFGGSKGYFGLTFALLKDTGWYVADDSFSEASGFGYQKGCSFILDACYSSTHFKEFCDTATQPSTNSYCQSTFHSKAICSNQAANMADTCGIYLPYFNCIDSDSISASKIEKYSYQVYAPNSFCVDSTFGNITLPSNQLSRCYPFVCGDSSIVFTIGLYLVTCLKTEVGTVKTLSGLVGNLTCPNFDDFCTNSRKTCSNWCNKNGFCTGGVCNCMPNRFGNDCSVTTCAGQQYYNPVTSSCVPSCPAGTYPNKYSHTCIVCQAPCATCASNPLNCLSCIQTGTLKFAYGGTCYSSCPNTTYTSGNLCITCDQSVFCKTCSMLPTNCTSCLNNRFLNNGACVTTCPNRKDLAYYQCVTQCRSYLFDNTTDCYFCSAGTYLLSQICQSNCSAATNTYPDENYHACLPCDPWCKTCDGPYSENCTSCGLSPTNNITYLLLKICWPTCPRGFYANLITNKCEVCPVQLGCQSCKYNTNSNTSYCTSCISGTYFSTSGPFNTSCFTYCSPNQFKNTWNNSCDPCHANCATCKGPFSFACLSCTGSNNLLANGSGGYCLPSCPTEGYTKVVSVCQPCDATCLICNGTSSSSCLACKSGYYYYGGYCRYICPAGTYPDLITQYCLPCDVSCSYCFNGTDGSCTSCASGKYLYNFTCGTACPAGMTPNQWGVCFQLLFKYFLGLFGLILMMIL